jgi:acyl carrier protein
MQEQIIEIIRDTLRLPKDQVINLDTDIAEELDGDSLDVIEIVIEIEEELDTIIKEEDLKQIRTIRQLVELAEAGKQ